MGFAALPPASAPKATAGDPRPVSAANNPALPASAPDAPKSKRNRLPLPPMRPVAKPIEEEDKGFFGRIFGKKK
jgi:hypothetical protein